MKPYEKALARLHEMGIQSYQEFSGYIGPRYWKLTMPNGQTRYACKVRTLTEIADGLQEERNHAQAL